MAVRISRQKIARYAADRMEAGDSLEDIVSALAAFLIDERRTSEVELLTHAIYEELERRGTVVATVVTAKALDDATREHIKAMTGAKELHTRSVVDTSIIGGIIVATPSRRHDSTIARRIAQLKSMTQQG